MPATEFKLRRGTAAQMASFTGAQNEITHETDTGRLVLHDGVTAGGAFVIGNIADLQKSSGIYAIAGGTANALTLTLSPALAAYTAGVSVKFKASASNTGAATININGLGAKTIKKMRVGALSDLQADDIVNGSIYELIYDGTNFQLQSSAIANSTLVALQVFTSSTTYNKTGGAVVALAIVIGAGGGAAGVNSATGAGSNGAGGGGCSIKRIDLTGISSETVTVGTGGTAGGTAPTAGSNGGTSSFGSHCSATGGSGTGISGSSEAGAAGVGSGGDINLKGGGGEHSNAGSTGGHGGNAPFGGGGGRGFSVGSSNGEAGGNYGGGGGGAYDLSGFGRSGGAGADGIVYVLEFA